MKLYFFPTKIHCYSLDQGSANIFHKGSNSKYFQRGGSRGLCRYGKAAIDEIQTDGHGCVPVELYEH